MSIEWEENVWSGWMSFFVLVDVLNSLYIYVCVYARVYIYVCVCMWVSVCKGIPYVTVDDLNSVPSVTTRRDKSSCEVPFLLLAKN